MCKRASVFFRLFVWEVVVLKKWRRTSRLLVVGGLWAVLAACGGGGDADSDGQAQPEQIGPEPGSQGMASRYTGTFSGDCGYIPDVTYTASGKPVKMRGSIRFIPKDGQQAAFVMTQWIYEEKGMGCEGEVIGHFTRASNVNLIKFVSAVQVPLAGKSLLAHRVKLHLGPVTRVTLGGLTMDHTSVSGSGDLALGPVRFKGGYLSQEGTGKDLVAVTDEGTRFYWGRDDSVGAEGYPAALEDRGPWWRQP